MESGANVSVIGRGDREMVQRTSSCLTAFPSVPAVKLTTTHCYIINNNKKPFNQFCCSRSKPQSLATYVGLNNFDNRISTSTYRHDQDRFKNYCLAKPENDYFLSSFQADICKQWDAFHRFCRPHTVIGTIIGISSVSLLPLESLTDLCPAFFIGLLKALVPSILMNIYVVGLNQLFDVEIDKVNKPELPLASGEFSMATGITIVSTVLLMSLSMGFMFKSPPLFSALAISFLLGSAYSIELPLLRWKKHAFLAATCILIVRAIVVQLAFYVHIQKFVLGRPIAITRSLAFAVVFMCIFSSVIALFKDIPDVEGDRDFGIQSFSVSLGQEKVYWFCVNMLLMGYASALVIGAFSSFLPTKAFTIIAHGALAFLLWIRARSVDIANKSSLTSFYMFIWKLFYVEYFLIPFIR